MALTLDEVTRRLNNVRLVIAEARNIGALGSLERAETERDLLLDALSLLLAARDRDHPGSPLAS